jgi:predicted lipase
MVVTDVIDDKAEDVQGYVGYIPSKSSIYVVYRGSTSISDWVNNIDVILTGYNKCSSCEVHKGFYKAEQAVIGYVTSAVQKLRTQFPSYKVVVTGHSLGAAMATLTSLDFLSSGIPNRMFNFGSPRVGNTNFANYASGAIADRNRVTHYKDMVPHVPMHERFTHISGEWYEDPSGLHECSGLEDKNCSYQWHITNVDDHMHYLGLYMGCDAVSASSNSTMTN